MRTVCFVASLVVSLMAGSVSAQVGFFPDFTVVIFDLDDPVPVDSTETFFAQVSNLGGNGDPTVSVNLDLYLPMDVPVNWQQFISSNDDTQTAIVQAFLASADIVIDDNIWNDDVSDIYVGESFDNSCESMTVQFQDLVLPEGTTGQISYEAHLPSSGGVSGVAYTPMGGDQVVVNHGVGGCNSDLFENCAGIPCMGPRLTMHPAVGSAVEIVDDGVDPTNDGCTDFSDTFTPGNIALIDRGACNFSVKAENATNAGAAGVIIANTAALGSVTPTEDSIMTMGCTDAQCHSLIITIPAAFFSYNSGEELKAWMDVGPVTMFMGVRQEFPEYKQTKGYIWESAAESNDVDPDNDRYTETTTFGTGGGGECTFMLSPGSRVIDADGGVNFVFSVATQPECDWTLDPAPSWVSITSPTSGTGYTHVYYDVAPNLWGPRIGAITLGDAGHSILQNGVADGGDQNCRLLSGPEDGSAEGALGWGFGDRFVQQFTPDTYPFSLGSACVAFTRAGADSELDFDLVIFDDDGPSGTPGTLLASIPSRGLDVPFWLDYAFTGVDLEGMVPKIESGSVFIGAAWNQDVDRPFFIPADFSPETPPQTAFFGTGDVASGWTPVEIVEPAFRSFFIHATDTDPFDDAWEPVVGQGGPTPNGFGDPLFRRTTLQFPKDDQHCVAVSNPLPFSNNNLYCSSDLISWVESFQPIGPYNEIVSTGLLDGSRVIGTENPQYGGEIWRWTVDDSWEQIGAAGISGPGLNLSFPTLKEFSGHLYAGTENNDGTQVIRTTDGITWETVIQDGLDSPANILSTDMIAFNDELYLGVTGYSGDCSIWKTADGIAWFNVIDDCFGTPGGSPLFATLGADLFVGLTRTGEIRRTVDGFSWPIVFSQPGMTRIDSLTDHEGGLAVAGGFEDEPGSTVWISRDGDEWTRASFPGFGKTQNESVPSLLGSRFGLLAGTQNSSQGAEVWLLPNSIFADGFESGDTSAW